MNPLTSSSLYIPDQTRGLSCKGTNYLLSSLDPAYQYQTQKIIQNSVRVPSSLYTMNVSALANYQAPLPSVGVNWNQMSDRAVPHLQSGGGSGGSFYHGSSLRRTQTGMRPGSTTPGGYGVDIKHNSYARYLNRIKGGKLLRRGPIPPTFGAPIPFTCAAPVYGGKTVKTAIVQSCPPVSCHSSSDSLLFATRLAFSRSVPLPDTPLFVVGQTVYARLSLQQRFVEATVLAVRDGGVWVEVQLGSDSPAVWLQATLGYVIPYFPCHCLDKLPNNNDYTNLALKYWFRDCFTLEAFTAQQNVAFLEKLYPLVYQFSQFSQFSNLLNALPSPLQYNEIVNVQQNESSI
jgi:hypothetical protein